MTDTTIPKALRPSTFGERQTQSLIRAARNPKGELHGLIVIRSDFQTREDKHGKMWEERVETLANRHGRPVALRYSDGGIQWLQQPGPPRPAPKPTGLLKRRSARGDGVPTPPKVIAEGTIPATGPYRGRVGRGGPPAPTPLERLEALERRLQTEENR